MNHRVSMNAVSSVVCVCVYISGGPKITAEQAGDTTSIKISMYKKRCDEILYGIKLVFILEPG
jgi:hypothetical protein